MSTSYSKVIEFTHLNDCVQTGCPGHKLRIIFYNTSDTLAIEIDGPPQYYFDPNTFKAAMQAYSER